MNAFDKFVNLYSLDKTLCLGLEPIGNTLENMNKNHEIETDEERHNDYLDMKRIIDDYHNYACIVWMIIKHTTSHCLKIILN